MIKHFNSTPHRVTHRISESPSPMNIPSSSARKPSSNLPAPLVQKTRCASCGGGSRRR